MTAPPTVGSRRAAIDRTLLASASIATAIAALALAGICTPDATYEPWNGKLSSGRSLVRWLFSAWTEPEFYTSALAGVGLLLGASIAAFAERTNKSWRGFDLAGSSGLWPWTLASSALGLLLSNIVWGWTLRATGQWQPTFVSVVSIAPTLVLVYGKGWRIALTGAALAALVVAPLSIVAVHFLSRPLGLPPVVGVTSGMAMGGFAAFALCRILPWLPPCLRHPVSLNPSETNELGWALRRMLADFSEAQFFGNEWASAGLILGALLALVLTPGVPVYGSGLLPQLFAAQGLAAAVSIAAWGRLWAKHGFYPTFVPVVSAAPAAVLVFDGTFTAVLGGALMGALVGPPLAAAISGRLPEGFHPFIGNVASMALSTAAIIPTLRLLHVPR